VGEESAVRDPSRRQVLATSAVALLSLSSAAAHAAIIKGGLPFVPGAGTPPPRAEPGPWRFFNADEAAAVETLVDRLIPPDPETPGGKDIGCAVFIDRQLAGPYGSDEGHYMLGPFQDGTPQQGPQSPLTPAKRYRQALAALDRYCRGAFQGARFAALPDAQKDKVIAGLEDGSVRLDGADGTKFFKLLLGDTQQGFFADPVYGGNRDMAAWKMIGFPGARYDYRDWVDRHNERYPHPPVSIGEHPTWKS
jgi:gluconate 2-dehydrogenase gamma chain